MSESAELEPWQQRALDAILSHPKYKYNGRGYTMMTGRQIGKSHLSMTSAALKRLMDDLASRPVEDLVLSEGHVYGARYYCIEPVGGHWFDMEAWCHETFGNSSTSPIWGESKVPAPAERWYLNNRKFWFRDLKDRDWFVLRWRS